MNAMQYHIITRHIRHNGQRATVTRPAKNAYGEPDGEEATFSISGLFHEPAASQGTYFIFKDSAHRASDEKKSFHFLCAAAEIYPGDIITINDRDFKVVSYDDVGNEHVFYDLSLEEVV